MSERIAVVYISLGEYLSRDEVIAKITETGRGPKDDVSDDLLLDLVDAYNTRVGDRPATFRGIWYPVEIKLQADRFVTGDFRRASKDYATIGTVASEFNFDDVEQAETASITTADLVQWMFESGKLADCYGNELDYVMKNSSSIELAIGRKPKMVITVGTNAD